MKEINFYIDISRGKARYRITTNDRQRSTCTENEKTNKRKRRRERKDFFSQNIECARHRYVRVSSAFLATAVSSNSMQGL